MHILHINSQTFPSAFPLKSNHLYDRIFLLNNLGNGKQQFNRCVHVFLSKCWRGSQAEDELTVEIESKMKLLRFHDEQEKRCGVGNMLEKTNLTVEMAVLYLGRFRF